MESETQTHWQIPLLMPMEEVLLEPIQEEVAVEAFKKKFAGICYTLLLAFFMAMCSSCQMKTNRLKYKDVYNLNVHCHSNRLTVTGFVGQSSLGIKKVRVSECGDGCLWIDADLGIARSGVDGNLNVIVDLTDDINRVLMGEEKYCIWTKDSDLEH